MAVIEAKGPESLDMSAVPKHLRARAAAADDALKNMREGRAPDQSAEQAQESQERQEGTERQGDQRTPPQTSAEPPRGEQRQEQRQDGKPEDWEQRYRSLQGQFEPLRDSNRTLRQENDSLREAVSGMEDRLRSLESNRPEGGQQEPKAFDIKDVLSEEERNDWGDVADIIDRAVKAAQAPLQAEIKRLTGKTEQREQSEQSKSREDMHKALDKDVPNWEEINKDPDFYQDWLLQTDEASGLSYSKLLQNAYNRNEAGRVAFFFKRYLSDKGRSSPEGQQDQGQGRAAAPKSLDRFAAPGKGKTVADPGRSGDQGDGRRILLSDYTKFHHDKALGRLRMTTAEIKQREAELDQAYRDGTIDLSK
ncbi:hypothetical protein WYO_0194 [Methylobacterium sp. GXF4]|uniref:hypothetical protein n=1 Tax=Methylobacterium sp. GXF4 TaxID=1096546 RepID=UPI0002698F5A|nr:hypothetical protein [Methylobacterium sp. GXF4]EIZ87157.1 hypothetical protein WYO_0194 [Methylobacterium sp. GXF4]